MCVLVSDSTVQDEDSIVRKVLNWCVLSLDVIFVNRV